MLGNTINGTIYAGIRARTTGAPQQMWFGPSGDPRSGAWHTGCSPVQYQAAAQCSAWIPERRAQSSPDPSPPPPPPPRPIPQAEAQAQARPAGSGSCVRTLSPGGIHTPEAIKLVWSSHREILYDYGPVPADHAKTQS